MSEQDGAIIIDFVKARMERLAQNAVDELNLYIRDAPPLEFFYFLWLHMMKSGLEDEKDLVIRDIHDEVVHLSIEGLIQGYPDLFQLVMDNPQYSSLSVEGEGEGV
jgi:hypothetical protein